MPTYEYRCPEGHEFELLQRMSDEPRAACPTCGQEAARLLSGGAGFLFKGDGFYITDYRSDAYRAAAKKEEGASSSTPAGKSAGSDAGTSGASSTPASPGTSISKPSGPAVKRSDSTAKPTSSSSSSSSSSSD